MGRMRLEEVHFGWFISCNPSYQYHVAIAVFRLD